jgi:hypothetical protein
LTHTEGSDKQPLAAEQDHEELPADSSSLTELLRGLGDFQNVYGEAAQQVDVSCEGCSSVTMAIQFKPLYNAQDV